MLGFVSALSSAVAVMILLMSVLLTNLLSVTLDQNRKKESANIVFTDNSGESGDSRTGKKKTKAVGPSKGFSLSVTDLLPLRNAKTGAEIKIYCTYGNNLSLDIAKKYTTYNYIVAKKTLREADNILVEQPVYDPTGKNNCIAEEVAK